MTAFSKLMIAILTIALSSCGRSETEEEALIEDSYSEGYLAALDCVERKGGSAVNAARDCENE